MTRIIVQTDEGRKLLDLTTHGSDSIGVRAPIMQAIKDAIEQGYMQDERI